MKQLLILLILAVTIGCSKPEPIEPNTPSNVVSLGYIDYNGYIQNLPCHPAEETGTYNSYDTLTNTLILHNDSTHLVITNSYNVTLDKARACGYFTTPKGSGWFLYVPYRKL
jgi:hypothetical protein